MWFVVCSQVGDETLEWLVWLTFRWRKCTVWFGAGWIDIRDQHQTKADRGAGAVSKKNPVNAATLWGQTSPVTRTNKSYSGGAWYCPCVLQWVTMTSRQFYSVWWYASRNA